MTRRDCSRTPQDIRHGIDAYIRSIAYNLECRRLMTRVHGVCAVQPCSALQFSRSTSSNHNPVGDTGEQQPHSPRQFSAKISTGLSTIDNYLHGGFATGSITEVVGRAGVGKTHLAQQLCVLAATTSSGGAIFIDTENKLSLGRLNEIAVNRSKREKSSKATSDRSGDEDDGMSPDDIAQHVLENVTVRSFLSTKELLETLDVLRLEITDRNMQAETNSRLPVRLLVIDSIAAPIRRDFDMMSSSSGSGSSSSAAQRAAALLQIASKLKQLASDFNLAVVVINQVGVGGNSIKQQGEYQRNDTLDIRDGEFTASLGTAWQYCVSTKIILEHDEDPHKQCQHHNGHVSARTATIAKSLLSRRAQVEFKVTDEGLCEVSS
ncbi:DNA repair protein RAD51B [Skeletonema marinoi]|uniref:DNA repair protein RAD51B n=1 Tax=Skeletonema marinoi TaxID=267567 RepID=A0AAD8YE00_9STRA|nr:DNA repair protein RAD51B [Skeletonema marinoi]